MPGLLFPLVITAIGAALWVGSLAGLQRLRLQWWPLALASIAVQIVLSAPPIDRQPWAFVWGPWMWVLCLLMMLTVLIRNALSSAPGRTAFRLAAVGVLANVIVVVANGGYMPQSPEARLAVRGVPLIVEGAPPVLRNVTPSGPETRLAWLGDVIPEPRWLPMANVVSVGDLALSLGLAWWAFCSVASGYRRPRRLAFA